MKTIIEKLIEIEQNENVRIIMAVESGSRAWGFASPDSDYDVRFIYVRKMDEYLRLDDQREVIEWQLDEVFDINGWDIRKALRLFRNCNPSVYEWIGSPVVYRTSPEFDLLKEMRTEYFSPKKSLYHYWHMAASNYKDHLQADQVKVKKYFYALRPVLAAKWVSVFRTPPPVLFSELLRDDLLTQEEKGEIEKLLEIKKDMPEMGTAPSNAILNSYIESNLQALKLTADSMPQEPYKGWDKLNEFFRAVLQS